MAVHIKRITDSIARSLRGPTTQQEKKATYVVHWCPKTPGFGVRVSANGDRAYIAQRRVDGKAVRRTIGKAAGASAISADAARGEQIDVSSELQRGTDRLELKRERIKAEKVDALTLETAVRDYAKGKRRSKDGLPLKTRTKADYIAMVEPVGATKTGKPTLPGALRALALKPLHKITGDDIRRLHASLEQRGERRQAYALQVLRAVLRHHGVVIEGDPLSPTTAGAARVRLATTKGNPTPIPPERLGAWWKAASATATVGADQLRFQLLTGCRPGEAAAIRVQDFDRDGSRIKLMDTKNRADHMLLLSRQAAEIVSKHIADKKPADLLFGVADAGKSLAVINAAASVTGITAHKLRHTFASIADDLVTAATRRAMMNHTSGDVGQVHYIGIGEAKLRAGWQVVADHIETAARA